MKAAVYFDVNQTKIIDKPIPELTEGEALLRVSHAGICGTDLAILAGKHPRAPKMVVFGHEFVGRVVEINSAQQSSVKKGDLVVVNPLIECKQCFVCQRGDTHICKNLKMIGIDFDGGMAQYVKVPLSCLVKVDRPDISERLLALTEPVAVAAHAVNEAKLSLNKTVAIIGAGPIGLLIAYLLRYRGFEKISLVDVNPGRLELAAKIDGVNLIDASKTDPVKEIIAFNNHNEVDCVFEVTGTKDGLESAFRSLAPKGLLMIVGVHKQKREINLQNLLYNEQSIKAIRVYTKDDFEEAVKLLVDGNFNPEFICTHIFPLVEISGALRAIASEEKIGKVLIDCA